MSKLETNPAYQVADAEALIYGNLPLAARDYLERMRAAEDSIRAEGLSNHETQQRLYREFQEAEDQLRRVQRAYEDAPNASEKDRDYVASQIAIRDSKRARLDAHQKKMDAKQAARAKAPGFPFEKVETHARKHWHVPHKDIPHAPLPEAEATLENLEAIRGKFGTAYAAIKAAQDAPSTVVEAFQRFKPAVESALKQKSARTSLGGFFRNVYDADGRPMPYMPVIDIDRLAVLATREMILSWGENKLREIADLHSFDNKKPLSAAARKKKIAAARAEIDKLELEEGRVLRALAAKGVFVPLRSNTANINSVLGIEPDAEAIASRKLANEAA